MPHQNHGEDIMTVDFIWSDKKNIQKNRTIYGVTGQCNSRSLPLPIDTWQVEVKSWVLQKLTFQWMYMNSVQPCHPFGIRVEWLVPVTLTVGDFLLSNVFCVEEKSISDFFWSFDSRHLFNQAETMCKHHKYPCFSQV